MLPFIISSAALIGAALSTESGKKALGIDDLWSGERPTNHSAHTQQKSEQEDAWRLKKIGLRLAFLREQKGLSASEVAEKSGISRPAVKNLEEGADMKLSTLFAVSTALGIPVFTLLDGLQPELEDEVKQKIELHIKAKQEPAKHEDYDWMEMETEDGKRIRIRSIAKQD